MQKTPKIRQKIVENLLIKSQKQFSTKQTAPITTTNIYLLFDFSQKPFIIATQQRIQI